MKNLALCLFSLLVGFTEVSAQEAFYIYRNDGVFNAFFKDDVDSIIYSKEDIDHIVQPEYVTQEIHTHDSIYRIPIEVIDSVCFAVNTIKVSPDYYSLNNYAYSIEKADTATGQFTLLFSEKVPELEKNDIVSILNDSIADGWSYDYEKFVEFDAPIREAYKQARAKARQKGSDGQDVEKRRIELRPPTIYKGSWRDAGKGDANRIDDFEKSMGASPSRAKVSSVAIELPNAQKPYVMYKGERIDADKFNSGEFKTRFK